MTCTDTLLPRTEAKMEKIIQFQVIFILGLQAHSEVVM